MGPEGGKITSYIYFFVNENLASITMQVVGIIGLTITLVIYIIVGKQIHLEAKTNLIICLSSIAVVNMLALLVIFVSTHTINSVLYISRLTLNAPFFWLDVYLSQYIGVWSIFLFALLPSIMILLGYSYPFKR